MPAYPIDGTVYDRDGTTAVAASVIAFNCTTTERTSVTCNASGQFILDLNNFPSGFTVGDHVQITAQYGNGEAVRSLSKRHTTSIAGFYSIGSMVLHAGVEPISPNGVTWITAISHANSTAAKKYVDFYDRNDAFIFRVEAALGDTNSPHIQLPGVCMRNGFIRVFESETAGDSEVLVLVR